MNKKVTINRETGYVEATNTHAIQLKREKEDRVHTLYRENVSEGSR